MIDTHAHLMDSRFQTDLEAVLERAWMAGLQAIVCVGYDLESSRAAVALAQGQPNIFATVGIHPNHAAQAGADDFREIQELAQAPKVVGIGETGLDNYRVFTPREVQEAFFQRHLGLAAEQRLPVVVHNRAASDRVTDLLLAWVAGGAGRTGVLHCFSGDRAMLERCVQAGLYVSFAGPLTYRNAGWLSQAAQEVPGDRMLVETDAPYLAPVPHRGRRNEPAFVVSTARRLAELRGEPFGEVAGATARNGLTLFSRIRLA